MRLSLLRVQSDAQPATSLFGLGKYSYLRAPVYLLSHLVASDILRLTFPRLLVSSALQALDIRERSSSSLPSRIVPERRRRAQPSSELPRIPSLQWIDRY